jgi:hypothetical protein
MSLITKTLHLKVNCVTLTQTLFHPRNGAHGIPFENIEVTDAIPGEEWSGHPSMGPIHRFLSIWQPTLKQSIYNSLPSIT